MISLLITNLNGARYLAECLQSVRQNIHYFTEIVVVDGQSTDGSLQMLSDFCLSVSGSGVRCEVLRREPRGIYDAWNYGVGKCCGEWVYILPCDDIIHSRFGIMADCAMSGQVCDIVGARFALIKDGILFPDGIERSYRHQDWLAGKGDGVPILIDPLRMLACYLIVGPFFVTITQIITKRSVLLSYPFDTNIGPCGDYPAQISWLKAGHAIALCDEVAAYWRLHAESASAKFPHWMIYEFKARNYSQLYVDAGIARMYNYDVAQAIAGMLRAGCFSRMVSLLRETSGNWSLRLLIWDLLAAVSVGFLRLRQSGLRNSLRTQT